MGYGKSMIIKGKKSIMDANCSLLEKEICKLWETKKSSLDIHKTSFKENTKEGLLNWKLNVLLDGHENMYAFEIPTFEFW